MGDTIIAVIAAAAGLLIGVAAGIFIGILIRKRVAEKKIGSAEEAAKKIEADAKLTATYETNRMIVAAQKEGGGDINNLHTLRRRQPKQL